MGEPEQYGRPAREAAAYVAELTADLARIARQHRLDALCYLLEMARMEAQSVAGARARRSENEVS